MNIAVILAGGLGLRLGESLPKQYIEVKGRPVISYCLDIFENHSEVETVWIVAEERWRERLIADYGEGADAGKEQAAFYL